MLLSPLLLALSRSFTISARFYKQTNTLKCPQPSQLLVPSVPFIPVVADCDEEPMDLLQLKEPEVVVTVRTGQRSRQDR